MSVPDQSAGAAAQQAGSGVKRCPSCGWENPPVAVKCGFCTAPLVQPKKPGALRPLGCPHCGAQDLYGPREVTCATCGKNLFQKPTVLDKGVGQAVRVVRGFQLSVYKIIGGLIVLLALIGFTVGYRGHMKAMTADKMRRIKQALLIFEGENGGFPESLKELQRRGLPAGPNETADSWKSPIRYTPTEPYPRSSMSEFGGPLFKKCEIRSAGPNGKFGDGDDLFWSGEAAQ